MSVRIAQIEDVPILVKLWKELARDQKEIALRENPKHKTFLQMKENAADMVKDHFEKQIQLDDALALLVEVEGKPIGFSLMQIQKNAPIFNIDRIGVISDLYIKSEYRGRRLSSKMMDRLLNWLKEKGINDVSIAFMAGNKHARKIYEKWGFREFHIGMRRTI